MVKNTHLGRLKLHYPISFSYKADGFNIIQNNGECAGQSVKHFRMHLFPRYEGDKALGLWKPGQTTDEELQELEDKVKEILN